MVHECPAPAEGFPPKRRNAVIYTQEEADREFELVRKLMAEQPPASPKSTADSDDEEEDNDGRESDGEDDEEMDAVKSPVAAPVVKETSEHDLKKASTRRQ